MIAFYCTILRGNSYPIPPPSPSPRLNISLRYNFLSRLYHFRVKKGNTKKKYIVVDSTLILKNTRNEREKKEREIKTLSSRIESQLITREKNLSAKIDAKKDERKNRIYVYRNIWFRIY